MQTGGESPDSDVPAHDQNRRAWDALADSGSQFSKVATDAQCEQPLLTLDSRGWLPGSVRGLDVLCLASGGGWQSILYACAGANVTVVDLSPRMLQLDRQEAERRGLEVCVIEAPMDSLPMLSDESFDIVHQPVSTCYVRRLGPVFSEVARVLREGGLYISQHKQPTSLQVVDRDEYGRYVLGVSYYTNDPLPVTVDTSYREEGAVEYLHRWDELIGELCAGRLNLEETLELVLQGSGTMGPCCEYLENTVQHLEALGLSDPSLKRLHKEICKRRD